MLISSTASTPQQQKLSDFSVSALCRTSPEPANPPSSGSSDAVVTNWRLDSLPVPATLPVLPSVTQPPGE